MEKEMNMEKQNCDSMTTVTVKDFNPQLDYQEPPPAYRPMKTSPMVQVAKIVAIAAVAIAGMLSFAIVFSAWLTNSSCQQQLHQMQQKHHQQIIAHQQQQPPSFEALIQNPESLKNLLALSSGPLSSSLLRERKDKDNSQEERNDLDSAESKTEANTSKNDSSSEEDDDNNNSGEEAVTMLRLPVELNFQEHMFDRNHRSHMNCIIEKKKAEEIVDEQAKPLPPLLGINMSTDPRYLHFTGEKMAISCDSGNDHRQPPPPPAPRDMPYMDGMMVPPPPPRGHHHHAHHHPQHPFPIPFGSSSSSERDSPISSAQSLASAIAAASSSSVPIQIIGPIPLSSSAQLESSPSGSGSNPLFGELGLSAQMIPILLGSSQGANTLDDLPISSGQGNSEKIFLGPYFSPNNHPNSPPHHTLHYQPHPHPANAPQHSSLEAQFPFFPSSGSAHPFQFSPAGPVAPHQSAEIRERAVPHPIPIMPRAHVQHVIRPRSVDALVKKRVKRCACDCACKNHEE